MNNTLTEAEKDKETKTDNYNHKDISKAKEKEQESTAGKESSAGKCMNTDLKNTTAVNREDKYTGTIPEKTASKDRNEGEPDERDTGPEKASEDTKDKVGSKGADTNLNTVEKKEPEVGQPPEKKQGNQDTKTDLTEITEIVVIKDKGQEEKEKKEEQVNGKRDPDKVGPNDTKLRVVVGEGENAVDNAVIYDTKTSEKENNSIGSPDENKIISTGVNHTQYTTYRAGSGEIGNSKEKPTVKEDKTEKDSAEKTKEELEREKEKEKEKEANLSFTGKRCRDQIKSNAKLSPSPLSILICVRSPPGCREKLPTSPSPLPWLPPVGVRGGARNSGVLL